MTVFEEPIIIYYFLRFSVKNFLVSLGIQEYCEELCYEAIDSLRSEGYTIEASKGRASHLFGIYFNENTTMERIERALSKYRVKISIRDQALRVSPNVYNDQKDIQRLLSALKEAVI